MKKFLIFLILALLSSALLLSCREKPSECAHTTLLSEEVVPTCNVEGYTQWQCADCSLQYRTDIVPPMGHSLTKTVTEPTCETEGFTHSFCIACGFSYRSDTVAPTGHTMTKTVTSPTCTKEGSTLYACACGYSYTSDTVAPHGHTFLSQTVAPTCKEAGYTLMTCSVCQESLQTDIKEPLGHKEIRSTVAPTCSEAGYTLHTCERCNYSYRAEYLSPLGHRFSTSIIHPTRTSAGAFVHTCSCQYTVTQPLLYSDVFTGALAEQNAPLAKGIDVSLYQHTLQNDTYLPLDWQAVKQAGFEFAILKAGSTPRQSAGGTPIGGIEPVFEMNYQDAKEAGVALGAYFYTYALTSEEARTDALRLVSWLEGKQFEYPIYFDLEDPSQENLGKDILTDICVTFISTLQENGYYAALYTNNDWLVNRLHGDVIRSLYDIWYARPPLAGDTPVNTSQAFYWNSEKYGPTLGMWQYTHHGVIEGIDGVEFDFNYVYRDYPSIIKKYGYNGYAAE